MLFIQDIENFHDVQDIQKVFTFAIVLYFYLILYLFSRDKIRPENFGFFLVENLS